MGRPAVFALTNPSAYNGQAVVYTLEELLQFPRPTWLIDGLVPHATLTGLAGPPGVGKSMLALDWGLCVATGTPWLGHAVDPGFVLYLAAEGHTGLSIRARAWLEHHKIKSSRARFGLLKGRLQITGAPELHDAEVDYDTLFKRIDDEMDVIPKLVIIDTLARCIDGDENASVDMTAFLDGAERFIDRYQSSVVIIHHKNAAGTRERGHTAFRGALGALFFFEPVPKSDHLLVLKNEKQRDAREHPDLGLRVVEAGESALLETCDLPDRSKRADGLPKIPDTPSMLSWLAGQEDGATHREWMLGARVPKDLFNRRVRKLKTTNEIYKSDAGRYHVMPALLDIAEDGEDEKA